MNVPTSIPFILGLLVIVFYAWGRFDEPSFPKEETLPSAVVPLRYLFLRPAYARARLWYVVISATLFFVLVLAGQPILTALGISAASFPPEAWPLSVALLLVGVVPNPNMKWINTVEERMRRAVHAWFLVPNGVKEAIAVMDDAAYAPPAGQLDMVREPLRSRIREGLAQPRNTLHYRWARAVMLIESIDQMGDGGSISLIRPNFEPFQDDFMAIRQTYKVLRSDIEPSFTAPLTDEVESSLKEAVDKLLRRIYAYISWGVRHQSISDSVFFDTLVHFGFRVPAVDIDTGRRLFDLVFPAFLLVIVLVFLYTLASDPIPQALSSALAAGLMYGGSAWIALHYRGRRIDETTWQPRSPRCLASIAIRAGLMTWGVIVLVTVIFSFPQALNSLKALWVETIRMEGLSETALWLPTRIGTALPWLLAGATFSVLLTWRLDGDLQRLEWLYRLRDASTLAAGLGLAAAFAELLQAGLSAGSNSWSTILLLKQFGVAFVIGFAMGFTVPAAFRRDMMKPPGSQARFALRDLLASAKQRLGGDAGAKRWAFTPPEDDTRIPITPAEAIRYRSYATSVWTLLDEAAAAKPTALSLGLEASVVAVVEGGRRAS